MNMVVFAVAGPLLAVLLFQSLYMRKKQTPAWLEQQLHKVIPTQQGLRETEKVSVFYGMTQTGSTFLPKALAYSHLLNIVVTVLLVIVWLFDLSTQNGVAVALAAWLFQAGIWQLRHDTMQPRVLLQNAEKKWWIFRVKRKNWELIGGDDHGLASHEVRFDEMYGMKKATIGSGEQSMDHYVFVHGEIPMDGNGMIVLEDD